MPVRSSLTYDHFRSIPLTLVMVLAFVVQAVAIVGLVNYLSDGYWEIWIYGLILMLSIGFGLMVAYWISWSYESVEIALKESQEKYRVLFQILPIGVSITDKEARILERNTISENWLGTQDPSEIECLRQGEINPNILRADGSPMPVEEYAFIKALQSNQAVYDVETGTVCTDGTLRWFSISASPIPLEQYGVVIVHVDISDRKFAEQAMRRSELKLQAFLDNAPTLIAIKDLEGKYLSVNQEFVYFMQVSEAEILGKYDYDFFSAETVKNIRRYELQAIFEGIAIDFEQNLQLPDGMRTFWVTQFPIMDNHDKPCAIASISIDISDRKLTEAALQESEARFQKIVTISPEAIYILVRHPDGNTFFEYASPASEELVGLSVEHLISSSNIRLQIFHPDDLAGYEREMEVSLKTMQMFQHEWRIVTPQGQTKWIKSQAMPERRANGDIAWYGFAIDISDRKQSEIALAYVEADLKKANQELQRLVNLDGLTQIANRRCFDERVLYEWQRLHREKQPLSLLMFDVDYFKRYNDHYGHQLGDECLLRISQAVDQLVCRPADLVARYGGEEFIVILPNTNLEGAIAVAKLVHDAIADLQIPHQTSDVSDVVTISMGIASDIPNLERSPYVLINQVDQALYYAKQQGRNRSVIFTD